MYIVLYFVLYFIYHGGYLCFAYLFWGHTQQCSGLFLTLHSLFLMVLFLMQLFLMVLRESYRLPRIKPELAACKKCLTCFIITF